MYDMIRFPGLGIELENVGKSITVFGFDIAYYGIIIGLGMLAGILLAEYEAKVSGQKAENYTDFAMYAIIFSIIGARLYFVILSWDNYKNDLLSIFNIREGGLAIYGGIIAAVLALFIFTKIKKLSFLQMVDTSCMGLILGQIIGRWGNFFNREAFGDYSDGFLAMQLPIEAVRKSDLTKKLIENTVVISGTEFIQVHPTFLYESLWNLMLLIFVFWYKKRKKFHGEVFCIYLLGYGLGRAWIEGLRTDQLLLPWIGLPASQVLAMALVVFSTTIILIKRKRLGGEENGH